MTFYPEEKTRKGEKNNQKLVGQGRSRSSARGRPPMSSHPVRVIIAFPQLKLDSSDTYVSKGTINPFARQDNILYSYFYTTCFLLRNSSSTNWRACGGGGRDYGNKLISDLPPLPLLRHGNWVPASFRHLTGLRKEKGERRERGGKKAKLAGCMEGE